MVNHSKRNLSPNKNLISGNDLIFSDSLNLFYIDENI